MMTTKCSRVMAASLIVVYASASFAQETSEPTLEFALSRQTNLHIALQPQNDHHRIHFLVRANRLNSVLCFASITCYKGAGEEVSEQSVSFIPNEDNQVFIVYLRSPKVLDGTALYHVSVGVELPSDEQISAGTGYAWQIARDARGEASINYPRPGEEMTFTIPVRRNVRVETPEGERFRVVMEERTMTSGGGLRFGVDTVNNEQPTPYAIRVYKPR